MATTYSAWTAAELDAKIASLKTAIDSAVSKKAASHRGRNLVNQDLAELRRQMDYYVAEKNKLDRSGIRVRRGIVKV